MNKPSLSNPMSYLLVAGGTLLFYMCAVPVMDSLSTLAQQSLANKIASLQKTQLELQKEMEEIGEEPQCAHAIGFQIESEEDDCDD